MKKWNRCIFYLIGATLLLTVAVQSYWNYKNYQQNKRQLIREIRRSLNDAVEEYYAIQTKKNTISIWGNNLTAMSNATTLFTTDTVSPKEITNIDVIRPKGTAVIKGKKAFQIFKGKIPDSLKISSKISSIVISVMTDSIDFQQIDSLFRAQLLAKDITLTYGFQHRKKNELLYESNKELVKGGDELQANSTFLKSDEHLLLRYNSPTREILLRSLWGILFSILLVLAILGSLWYLLYIIRQQKQISEMKNDLISNITHEFKTPIATASAAIEAMQNFKILEDKSKTENYLKMSEKQLKKLHLMVEKLLETASLDSAAIVLEKEAIDLVAFLEKQVAKFTVLTTKAIDFKTESNNLFVEADAFHLENVVSNLIDNALKYGGDHIRVLLSQKKEAACIEIMDNGGGIQPQYQKHIFDKFYRIPKGNRHDVKGFGVGLYYAQQIVQKHGGTLVLSPHQKETIFRINLPNG